MHNMEARVIDFKIINEIAKNYSPLCFPVHMVELLQTAFPDTNFSGSTKYELHHLINELLFSNFRGEQLFKYKLFKQHFTQKSVIGAFEIKVNNSRADFLAVNGHSSCFEIKTSLDNLSKLNKQAADYLSVFEYNTLIIDESHLEKAMQIIPESFGLWVYKNGKSHKIFNASLNSEINPEVQISLLSKAEIGLAFPKQMGEKIAVLKSNSPEIINGQFKEALKFRYKNRWHFLKNNVSSILPVDLPFFFNTNVSPASIYCIN
jgi:hypothetical protein